MQGIKTPIQPSNYSYAHTVVQSYLNTSKHTEEVEPTRKIEVEDGGKNTPGKRRANQKSATNSKLGEAAITLNKIKTNQKKDTNIGEDFLRCDIRDNFVYNLRLSVRVTTYSP